MNRIDTIRTKKHLSYGKISKATGLTANYIFLLAKGKRTNPSLNTMQKISNALNEKVEKVFDVNKKEGEMNG